MKFALKTTGQGKPVGTRFAGQIGQADVFPHMGMQIVPCAMGYRCALQMRRQALAPLAVPGKLPEQIIHGALLHNAHLFAVQ